MMSKIMNFRKKLERIPGNKFGRISENDFGNTDFGKNVIRKKFRNIFRKLPISEIIVK